MDNLENNLYEIQKLNEVLRKLLKLKSLIRETKIYAKDLYYTIPYDKMNLDEKNEISGDINTILNLLNKMDNII